MLDPALAGNSELSWEGLAEEPLCPLHRGAGPVAESTMVPGMDLVEPNSAAPVLGLCFLLLRGVLTVPPQERLGLWAD